MDAPFVWTYRRDYINTSITRNTLWRIYSLDEDYVEFNSKKNALLYELHALQDAAKKTMSSESAANRAEDNMEAVKDDLQSTVNGLQLQLEDAIIEYNRLKGKVYYEVK